MALNYYETIVILDDRITETDYKAMVEHYMWYFTEELKGIIKDVDEMGKKKLAYPIKIKDSKHECKDGWYILFTYKMLPENISKIETKLREDGAVIKFLTVKRDPEEDELSEYAEVPDDRIEEEAKSPAEILAGLNVESEQSSGLNPDCWDIVFNLKGVG